MRWLFHVLERDRLAFPGGRYAPRSLEDEGFVHASYRGSVVESARLYFPPDADLCVLVIDPRRLDCPVDVANTPRGPMPHIQGPIRRAAIVAILDLSAVDAHDDAI